MTTPRPEDLKALYGADYVAAFGENQSPDRLGRLVARMRLDSTMSVADFACGNAMLMDLVAPRVRAYTGVDFSAEFIAAAEARRDKAGLANARFACADIVEFCAAHPASFDAAFAMDFSEHVPDEAFGPILAAIRRSLKPGASLYLHTPDARFFLERMKARNFIVKQFPEHVAVRTPRQNANLLEAAGFHIERLVELPHYNVLKHLHPLRRLPGLGGLMVARTLIEARA